MGKKPSEIQCFCAPAIFADGKNIPFPVSVAHIFHALKTVTWVFLIAGLLTNPTYGASDGSKKLSQATMDLFNAAQLDDVDTARQAIKDGADVDAKNNEGLKAVDVAMQGGNFNVANFLLSDRSIRKITKPKPRTTPRKKRSVREKPKTAVANPAPPARAKSRFPEPKQKPHVVVATPPETGTATEKPGQKPLATAKPAGNGALTPPRQTLIVAPGTPENKTPPAETRQPARTQTPAKQQDEKPSAIARFFSSLVDLVTPEKKSEKKPSRKKPPIMPDDVTVEENPAPVPQQSTKTIQSVAGEDIPPEVPEGFEDNETGTPDPTDSATRTLKRIGDLLNNNEPEDEFGLPVVADKKRNTKTATRTGPKITIPDGDDVIIIDEQSPSVDDTGKTDDGRPLSVEERLARIQRVLNRNVKVDTSGIIKRNRELIKERAPELYAPRQQRTVSKLPSKPLSQRSDPKKRLEGRLARQVERLRQQETTPPEDANGLPLDMISGSPEIGPDDYPDDTARENDDQKPATPSTSIIDSIARLFTSGKDPLRKNKPGEKKIIVDIEDGYQRAPSQSPPGPIINERTGAAKISPPESMLKKDGDPDAGVKPGRLSPEMLDKIATLLETEQRFDKDNWQADIEAVNPELGETKPTETSPPEAENRSKPAPVPDTWTTVVEQPGENGAPPVVVKRTETTVTPPAPRLVARNQGPIDDNFMIDIDMAVKDLSGELPPIDTARAETPKPAKDSKKLAVVDAETLYTDPLRAPKKQPEPPAKPKKYFSRLSGLFQAPGDKKPPPQPLALEPTEKLASAVVAKTRQQGGGVPGVWPVVNVKVPENVPVNPTPPGVLRRTSLEGVTFSLGQSVTLENSFPPGKDGSDPNNQCVRKNRGTTLFCIEPVDWPENIEKDFIIPTILYTGPMAIVRYDQGNASRLHSLFLSEKFEDVANYYQSRYGEPTEIWKRSIAPLAQPRQDNPTLTWRSRDPETNAVSILEIRKFDDTRGGFPDTKRGAVMLYYANSAKIFPQVSSNELMRIQRASNETKTEDETKSDTANDSALKIDDNATDPADTETGPVDDTLDQPLDDSELDSTFDEELDKELDQELDDELDNSLDDELNDSLDDSNPAGAADDTLFNDNLDDNLDNDPNDSPGNDETGPLTLEDN